MILSQLLIELVTLYAFSLNGFDMVLKTSMCVESVDRRLVMKGITTHIHDQNCYSCYLLRIEGLLLGTHYT